MTSDLLSPSRNVYALCWLLIRLRRLRLRATMRRLPPRRTRRREKTPMPRRQAKRRRARGSDPRPRSPNSTEACEDRPCRNREPHRCAAVAAGDYLELVAGKPGTLYFRQAGGGNRFSERSATLSRFVFDTRKTEKLADRVASFDLSADGEKMLLALTPEGAADEAQAAALLRLGLLM